MDADTRAKLEKLRGILRSAGSAVVAFSGGVDSSFLLKVAVEELGQNVLAVTADSIIHSCEDMDAARRFSDGLKIQHEVIKLNELELPAFKDNTSRRCYYCKRELFTRLVEMAKKEGLAAVLDGSNADDASDYRPGADAARELGVKSPLADVGLRKDEIRSLSRGMGIPDWDRPSESCLASRIPYGTSVTEARLKQVADAERYLKEKGFPDCRVRHHLEVARIEVPEEQMQRLMNPALRIEIYTRFREIGFNYVALDLLGYRTGSLNEPLGE